MPRCTCTFCPRCISRRARPSLGSHVCGGICLFVRVCLSHEHACTSRTPSLSLSLPSIFSLRWRAGNHSAFWGMTLDEGMRYRLGTIRPSPSVTSMNEIHVSPSWPTILPPHGLRRQGPWHPVSCWSEAWA